VSERFHPIEAIQPAFEFGSTRWVLRHAITGEVREVDEKEMALADHDPVRAWVNADVRYRNSPPLTSIPGIPVEGTGGPPLVACDGDDDPANWISSD